MVSTGFVGCINNNVQPPDAGSSRKTDTVQPTQTVVESKPVYPSAVVKNDTLVVFEFGPNDTTASASANVDYKGHNRHITCLVQVNKAKKLEAQLFPEQDTANIRFSQIFMPDGSSDGPFDRKLSYRLSKKGQYKLLIGENMMAGDEWKGKVKITISLK